MRIISLKKLVEDNDINRVEVSMGEGVKPISFDVGSPDYREQENFLVKGEYQIHKDPMTMANVLKVDTLQDGLNITINKPEVNGEQLEATEEEKKLEEFLNTPITAFVFNRKDLMSAGKEMKRQHVTAFATAVLEKYQAEKGEATLEDFAVVEIDWNNRHIVLKSIGEEEKVKE